MSRSWAGKILLDAGTIFYVGPGGTAEPHAHHAVQLIWSAGADELQIALAGQSITRTAVLIPANEPHAIEKAGDTVALVLLESHGARGATLNRIARQHLGRELAGDLDKVVFPPREISADGAIAWCDRLASVLGSSFRSELSSVSRRAIEFIEANLDENTPSLIDAADRIGISPTRLTHVFSKEVGIPFRRYVLWARIKNAVAVFQRGNDLTTAALAAGFSDAAHFSRTFRAMFGLSPSLVLPLAEIAGAWITPQ